MQRESNKTEQMVPEDMTDKYVLSELVLFGVHGSNMISGYYSLLCIWAAAKRERITCFICL